MLVKNIYACCRLFERYKYEEKKSCPQLSSNHLRQLSVFISSLFPLFKHMYYLFYKILSHSISKCLTQYQTTKYNFMQNG